jgi:hypothetical protein
LEKKYSNIRVIAEIVQAVKQSSHLLLNHLLSQLKTNIQLPACLRIIGYLRRMNCFSEAELRIKFLQARDNWLQANLRSIPDTEPHTHIMKTIESCRVHMFDIITQYRAIFSDEDSNDASESILFHSWVVNKIADFLLVLETDLSRGCASHLEAILAQSMYFGLSFSRVGADFRPQLVPIFLVAAERIFAEQIAKAEQDFLDHMAHFHLSDSVSLFSAPVSTAVGVSIQPPPTLLEYLPLAVIANGCQTAFTNLRLCCPLALGPTVKKRLTLLGQRVVQRITKLHRAEAASFNARERDSFNKLCSTVSSELLPFLNVCLSHLFPPASMAETLGLPVRESVEICQLKIGEICEPLAQHIPTEDEIVIPTEETEQSTELERETPKPEATGSESVVDGDKPETDTGEQEPEQTGTIEDLGDREPEIPVPQRITDESPVDETSVNENVPAEHCEETEESIHEQELADNQSKVVDESVDESTQQKME